MAWWRRLRDALGLGPGDDSDAPGVRWLAADETPFGVELLDVAPMARAARSTPSDPSRAEAARSALEAETGAGVATWRPPEGATTTVCDLAFVVDPGGPGNGALFRPRVLEEKWGLFVWNDRIIGVRAWTGQPVFELTLARTSTTCRITQITGDLGDAGSLARDPDHRAQVVDYLIRSHGLGEILPAPLPPGSRSVRRSTLAHALFQRFGRRALAGTEADLRHPRPTRPLRVDTPAWLAAAMGDADALRSALNTPGNARQKGVFDGTTPLHAAAGLGSTTCVSLLLDHGVEVDIADDQGGTPLLRAARQHSAPVDDTVALLLSRGADPNVCQADGTTALHLATRAGRSAVMAHLLRAGANPDPVDVRGFSPLHSAAELGIVKLIDALVAAGADPRRDAPGPTGPITPIDLATSRGHAAAVARLSFTAGPNLLTTASASAYRALTFSSSGLVRLPLAALATS